MTARLAESLFTYGRKEILRPRLPWWSDHSIASPAPTATRTEGAFWYMTCLPVVGGFDGPEARVEPQPRSHHHRGALLGAPFAGHRLTHMSPSALVESRNT